MDDPIQPDDPEIGLLLRWHLLALSDKIYPQSEHNEVGTRVMSIERKDPGERPRGKRTNPGCR